jgi:circadian clock protein KaiC
MTADQSRLPPDRISTGIPGLDAILGGGVAARRLYLVEGAPGAGKTTLALQFLLEGRARGEHCLYITLSETEVELTSVAASHGWDLQGIDLFELAEAGMALNPEQEITLLHPWEVELGEIIRLITAKAEQTRATRIVLDSLSEMRLLAEDPLRFRRQVLALKQFFANRGATVLLLDDRVTDGRGRDLHLHSLCHGVVSLERFTLEFGAARRRIEVAKMRGAPFSEGWHDYVIGHGGLQIFPRLRAAEHHTTFVGDGVPSGIDGLDAMLDGGPLRGTCTVISGPAGAGKSTLSLQYVHNAAARGEHCVLYQFDERAGTLLARAGRLGLDLQPFIDSGHVIVRQIDPAELSPGEFIHRLRQETEAYSTRILVIDSLNGYLSTFSQEKQLVLQLHELLSYLNQRGVLTLLISPQQGLMGSMQSQINISYIADTIILLRFFEAAGRIRKAISVIKNRGGPHEETIRELRIDSRGLRVGETLSEFHGVLSGTPVYEGHPEPLLEVREEPDA